MLGAKLFVVSGMSGYPQLHHVVIGCQSKYQGKAHHWRPEYVQGDVLQDAPNTGGTHRVLEPQ